MKKWQYLTVTHRTVNFSSTTLDSFGKDGWELVNIVSHSDKYNNFITTAYFKKELIT